MSMWLEEEVVKARDDPGESKAMACGSRTLGQWWLVSPW